MYLFHIINFILLTVGILNCAGNPAEFQNTVSVEPTSTSSANIDDQKELQISDCKHEHLDLKDVEVLKNGRVFVKSYNKTMPPSESHIVVKNLTVCFNRSSQLKKAIFERCDKWLYFPDEFTELGNGSVLLYGVILEPGTYDFYNERILKCADGFADDGNSTSNDHNPKPTLSKSPLIIMGKIGCSISIIALTAHLITFCLVPSMRNLPGYNLASLSLAFLIAYSFMIIAQIPEVLGLFCVLSGAMQQNFFLVAFFCMNVMAFDIWKTLKRATSQLTIISHNKKRTQFIMYTIYSWGVPLMITTITVIMDNVDGAPLWLKPNYGKEDVCYLTSMNAKAFFFSIPAFALFMVNGVFFVLSAFIIKNNTMKSVSDQQKQTARLNFILYVRLGLMMGVTWLVSVIATASNSNVMWIISDILNSLQGLFVFLLFTCSRKVFKHIREQISSRTPKTSTSDKQTTVSSKSDTH